MTEKKHTWILASRWHYKPHWTSEDWRPSDWHIFASGDRARLEQHVTLVRKGVRLRREGDPDWDHNQYLLIRLPTHQVRGLDEWTLAGDIAPEELLPSEEDQNHVKTWEIDHKTVQEIEAEKKERWLSDDSPMRRRWEEIRSKINVLSDRLGDEDVLVRSAMHHPLADDIADGTVHCVVGGPKTKVRNDQWWKVESTGAAKWLHMVKRTKGSVLDTRKGVPLNDGSLHLSDARPTLRGYGHITAFCWQKSYLDAFMRHQVSRGLVWDSVGLGDMDRAGRVGMPRTKGMAARGMPHGAEYIYIDIDNDDLDRARRWCVALSRTLDDLRIPHQIYYTGRKGFHLHIHQSVLGGIEATTDTCDHVRRWVRVVRDLARERPGMEDLEVDMEIYRQTSTIRLPLAQHEETGRYKVPITPRALTRWGVPQIERWGTYRGAREKVEPTDWTFSVNGWWIWQVTRVDRPQIEIHQKHRHWPHADARNVDQMIEAVRAKAERTMTGEWHDTGSAWRMHCILPTHPDDDTPSAHLIRKENGPPNYFCFGCGGSMSLPNLAEQHLGIGPEWEQVRENDVAEKRGELGGTLDRILGDIKDWSVEVEQAKEKYGEEAWEHLHGRAQNWLLKVSAGLGKTTTLHRLADRMAVTLLHLGRSHVQNADTHKSIGVGKRLGRPEEHERYCETRYLDEEHSKTEEIQRRAMLGSTRPYAVCGDCDACPAASKDPENYPTRIDHDGNEIGGPCRYHKFLEEDVKSDVTLLTTQARVQFPHLVEMMADTRDAIVFDEDPLVWVRPTEEFSFDELGEMIGDAYVEVGKACKVNIDPAPEVDVSYDDWEEDGCPGPSEWRRRRVQDPPSVEIIGMDDPVALGQILLKDLWEHLEQGELPPPEMLPSREILHEKMVLTGRARGWIEDRFEETKRALGGLQLPGLSREVTDDEVEAYLIDQYVTEEVGDVKLPEVDERVTLFLNLMISGRVEGVQKRKKRQHEDGDIPPKIICQLRSGMPADKPIIVLDASPHERDIEALRSHIPDMEVETLRAYNPDARLIQDMGSVWSRDKIEREVAEWRTGNKHTRTGRLVMLIECAVEMGVEWGIITHKDSPLVALLEDILPDGAFRPFDEEGRPLQYAWFGNLRGLNVMEDLDVLFVVGSQLVPSWGHDADVVRFGYNWIEEEHVTALNGYAAPHGGYTVPFSAPQPITQEGEHLWHRSEVSTLYQAAFRVRPLDGTPLIIMCTHIGVEIPEVPTTYDPYLLWRDDEWESILGGSAAQSVAKPDNYDGPLAECTIDEIERLTSGDGIPLKNTEIADLLNVDRDTVAEYQVLAPKERRLAALERILSQERNRSWKEIADEWGVSSRTLRNLRKILESDE